VRSEVIAEGMTNGPERAGLRFFSTQLIQRLNYQGSL
jgi:hypothetical protein